MRSWKPVLALVAACTLAMSVHAQNTPITSARMWIEGTSTVHDFSCDVGSVQGAIGLGANAAEVNQAQILVPVSSIDCDNGTMNRKVREALNAGRHPGITFTFRSASAGALENDWQRMTVLGDLELNGTKRPVTLALEARKQQDGSIVYRGQAPVNMREHDVKPPTAMLGALKAGEEVTVHFEVRVER